MLTRYKTGHIDCCRDTETRGKDNWTTQFRHFLVNQKISPAVSSPSHSPASQPTQSHVDDDDDGGGDDGEDEAEVAAGLVARITGLVRHLGLLRVLEVEHADPFLQLTAVVAGGRKKNYKDAKGV